MEKQDDTHSPMPDETNVRILHEMGKRLCYYAELDPYAGRWLPQPFQTAAIAAVRQIKLLTLVFDHIIFPPGYLLKNPAALMVFQEMKALFESGVLSVSIGEEFQSDPWLFFLRTMETEGIVREEARKPDNHTVREVRNILDGGRYLFRDRSVQSRGFGAEAVQMTHGLLDGENSGVRAFSHGVERLVGEHLESSRDDWMALLHHPAHRPSPSLSARVGAYINFAYLEQGWLGNHCVMYPSDFLVAHGDPGVSRPRGTPTTPPLSVGCSRIWESTLSGCFGLRRRDCCTTFSCRPNCPGGAPATMRRRRRWAVISPWRNPRLVSPIASIMVFMPGVGTARRNGAGVSERSCCGAPTAWRARCAGR